MSHGYDRFDIYEAGANRSRSRALGCLDELGKIVLGSEHTHRKMNKSHMGI